MVMEPWKEKIQVILAELFGDVSEKELELFLKKLIENDMLIYLVDEEPPDELELIRSMLDTIRSSVSDPVARIRIAEYVASVISGEMYIDE